MHKADIPECTILQQKIAHMRTFLLQNGALWDIELVKYEVCEMGLCMSNMPRKRLVGRLRPIGRSPGVPAKSSQSLVNMSRYSAQILICLIAYILQFSIALLVWLGALQNCHHVQSPLPLSIAIKLRLLIRQSNFPSCIAEVQQHENTLWELCHRTEEIDR